MSKVEISSAQAKSVSEDPRWPHLGVRDFNHSTHEGRPSDRWNTAWRWRARSATASVAATKHQLMGAVLGGHCDSLAAERAERSSRKDARFAVPKTLVISAWRAATPTWRQTKANRRKAPLHLGTMCF